MNLHHVLFPVDGIHQWKLFLNSGGAFLNGNLFAYDY